MWVLSVYPMGAHTLEDNIAMNAPARCKAIIVLSPCNILWGNELYCLEHQPKGKGNDPSNKKPIE